MVVEHGTVRAVRKDALPAGPVDVVVAGEHGGAAAAEAAGARGVDKPARRARRAADADLVLGAGGGLARVVAAADALGPEQVVVARAVVHEAALLRVRARRLVGDLVRRRRGRVRVGRHGRLVQVAPEGAKVHVVRRADGDQVRVDGVVRLGRRRRDARRAVVRPGPVLHGRGCCVSCMQMCLEIIFEDGDVLYDRTFHVPIAEL